MAKSILADTPHEVAEAIREDAAAHPERSYREHIAAESYKVEIRRMMDAGTLDDEEEL